MDDFGFLQCFRSGCYLHFRYLNTSNFFVSELNYQVLVCIFLVRMQGTFWYQDCFDLSKLFVFVSPAFHMLSTDRWRNYVHVLFGDVSYDVRNWLVNNQIKRKITLFKWLQKIFSSRVMKTFKFSLVLRTRENTDVFITLDGNIYGIHSERVNFLFILLFNLFILIQF